MLVKMCEELGYFCGSINTWHKTHDLLTASLILVISPEMNCKVSWMCIHPCVYPCGVNNFRSL